jgi:hypothetical protein
VIGSVVEFDDRDYLYGTGKLRIRLERIDANQPFTYDADTWYQVTGVEIGPNGADLVRRRLLVRTRRLTHDT